MCYVYLERALGALFKSHALHAYHVIYLLIERFYHWLFDYLNVCQSQETTLLKPALLTLANLQKYVLKLVEDGTLPLLVSNSYELVVIFFQLVVPEHLRFNVWLHAFTV